MVQTFDFVGGQILGGKPVKGQPYSAEATTTMTQTLADGSHIVNSSTSMVYRDSEGRERREESIGRLGAWNAQGPPAKVVFISDPVANVSYSLDTSSKTARKTPMAAEGAVSADGGKGAIAIREGLIAPPPLPPPGSGGDAIFIARSVNGNQEKRAAKVEQLGTQVMEGVTAEGTRTTVTIPAGQIGNDHELTIVSERWFSPDLQVVVMSRHSDPRMGETVYKLTNINRTEPVPSLFEVPADYTVTAAGAPMFLATPAKKDQ